jgi:hypothetical protein
MFRAVPVETCPVGRRGPNTGAGHFKSPFASWWMMAELPPPLERVSDAGVLWV